MDRKVEKGVSFLEFLLLSVFGIKLEVFVGVLVNFCDNWNVLINNLFIDFFDGYFSWFWKIIDRYIVI